MKVVCVPAKLVVEMESILLERLRFPLANRRDLRGGNDLCQAEQSPGGQPDVQRESISTPSSRM